MQKIYLMIIITIIWTVAYHPLAASDDNLCIKGLDTTSTSYIEVAINSHSDSCTFNGKEEPLAYSSLGDFTYDPLLCSLQAEPVVLFYAGEEQNDERMIEELKKVNTKLALSLGITVTAAVLTTIFWLLVVIAAGG